ncbi:MAG: lipopolysaccharide biosynthesis protein [Sulfurifustis sp.]
MQASPRVVAAPAGSVFRPAFVLMSGRALGFVAAFAIPVVLARALDQSDFGTYKQLFLIFSTLYGVAQLGMAEGLFYFLPAAPRNGGKYVLNAALVLAGAGAVCAAALWSGQASVAHWLNNDALGGYVPLIGLFLLLMLVSTPLEIAMIARKRHLHASGAYAISDLARAALLVVPVLAFGGLQGLMLGAVAFALLRLGAALFYLAREFRGEFTPDAGLLRAQFAYAAPFALYVLIDVAQTNLHLYAVSARFDAATFAVYAVGCLSIPFVDFLTGATANVMMVRMREDLLTGQSEPVLALWRDTTRKLALLLVPLVGGLITLAHELIVGLFTAKYAASVPVFIVSTLTILCSTVPTDAVLRVYAQIRFLMWLSVVKLVLIAVTISSFLAVFGLYGAVLATLTALVVTKAIALVRIRTVMHTRFTRVLPWRALASILALGAAAALPALAVKSALTHANLVFTLATTGSIYAASYAGLLWRCGPLSAAEKRALLDWAQRPLAGVRRSAGW